MDRKMKRIAVLVAFLALLAVLVAASLVAGESYTWDDEGDFEDGDFESTLWDTDADGIALTGRDSFWKYRGNRVISQGTTWDDDGVMEPCVVFAKGQYYVYYTGFDGTDYAIGLARSTDGFTFSKYGTIPLISKGPGTYDGSSCRDPFVLYDNGVFKMWYTGINGAAECIAYATSKNGLTWTKYSSNPVITQPSSPDWGFTDLGDPCVLKVNGQYWMYFSGSTTTNYKLVGLATSTDGISWNNHGSNPINSQAAAGFGQYDICDVAVWKDDSVFRMYFSGRNSVLVTYSIGYAYSHNGLDWVTLPDIYINIGPGGSFDEKELQSPCVIDVDGTLVMYYHGTDDSTTPVHGIGQASLKDWFLKLPPNTNPILSTGSAYDAIHLLDPCVLRDYTQETYHMFYTCFGGGSLYPYRIAVASSNSLSSWPVVPAPGVKYTSNPIIPLGSATAWDDERVQSPSVIIDNGDYKMWFAGYDGSTYKIGYATGYYSSGWTWTKYGSNPVLSTGSTGAWDSAHVMDPWVLKVGNILHMYYVGASTYGGYQIGHATSTDGTSWTKDSNNPVLTIDPFIPWEGDKLREPCVIYQNGMYIMYYTSYSGSTGQRIGVAYSTDGNNWSRDIRNPVLDRGNGTEWDNRGVQTGSVYVEGASRYLFFSGNITTSWTVGFATLPTHGGNYTTPVLDASAQWPVQWSSLAWDANVPAGSNLRFQVATNNGGTIWNFVGPDGTSSTYFENPSEGIFWFQSGRYIRVRAIFKTDNSTNFLPILRSITVSYQQRPAVSPPIVTVKSPNGGEDWMKTKTYPIIWEAAGNLNATSVSLDYSTDNGTTWTSISSGMDNTGFYKWTVPSTETSGALIRVTVIDVDGMMAIDTSDATFAIDPPPPKSGQFLSPLRGGVLAPGDHRASWQVNDPWGLAERPLTLELTTDGGITWVVLADDLPLNDGVDWDTPALTTSSSSCQLRLTVLSWLGDISIIASGEFTIDVVPPSATIDPIEDPIIEGEAITVVASVVDDLDTQDLVLHVSGVDGVGERTVVMSMEEDGGWTASYVPVEGDLLLWVTADDGAHQTTSATVNVDVFGAPASDGGGTTSSLAWELVLAAVVAMVILLVIVTLRRER